MKTTEIKQIKAFFKQIGVKPVKTPRSLDPALRKMIRSLGSLGRPARTGKALTT